MYRSLYGSSLISTTSGPFLSATLALTLTLGNPRGRNSQLSGPAYSYTWLSLSSCQGYHGRLCLRCRNHHQVWQSYLQGMTIPSPQEATPCSGAKWGQEENDPQHSSVLIFVTGAPKQQCLSLRSHKAITLMWHFLFTKCFHVFSFLFLCTQTSIITDKVLINYD